MNHNIAPDLTPFVIAFVVLDLIAALAVVGALSGVATAFFRTHRAVRVQRHQAFLPYYRRVALHH
jgi:hypothetical protein